MLTSLTIKNKDGGVLLRNNVKIAGVGTIDVDVQTASQVTISAYRQKSLAEFNTQYTRRKRAAMAVGGSLSDAHINSDTHVSTDNSIYKFDKGYRGVFLKGVLLSVNSATGYGNNNKLDFLPSKTLDVAANKEAGEISISLAPNIPRINVLYYDIDKLIWRLYHCYNSLAGRLQLCMPDMPVDGSRQVTGKDDNGNVIMIPDRGRSTMGRYLGTLIQYQTLVARWNHYAWSSSFYLDVVEAGNRVAITVGYTATDCYRGGLTYSVSIVEDTANNTPTETYKSDLLTIYNQGSDSTLDKNKVIATTTYYRNGSEVSGTGYEGKSPSRFVSAEVVVGLKSTAEKDTALSAVFQSEQYHRTLLALAPCIGIDKEYLIPDPKNVVTKKLLITATWVIDGEKFIKTASANIDAVGVVADEDIEELS